MTTGSMRQKRERAKRLSWLTEAQAALGWGIILALVAVLGAIYLSQASRIAVTGRQVQIMQNELEALKRDNATFEKSIAELQSLDRLQARAREMGFVAAQPENIEYLVIPDYPLATAVPFTTQPQPDPVTTPTIQPLETMEEAIWRSIRQSVGSLIQGEAGEQ
jgi:cell division protein FtsB